MAGVRIVHAQQDLAGKTLVVPTRRRYGAPRLCSRCGTVHEVKHYHIRLDGQAAAIVSETVLEGLRQVGMAGFEVESEVESPPPLVTGNAPVDGPNRRDDLEARLPESVPLGAGVLDGNY